MIEQATRLQRQFFRLGGARARAAWEPPADVFEDDRAVVIVTALPGVRPGEVDVTCDGQDVVIRAVRRLPFGDRACVIRQLEIPHGTFEKRIPLRGLPLAAAATSWSDGCLVVTLRKAD